MSLKDIIKADINIFFNINELAEEHSIDGKIVRIVVDSERLNERSKKEFDGISLGEILFFINTENFNKRPMIGQTMVFDNRLMYITSISEQIGLYEIILSQNRGD